MKSLFEKAQQFGKSFMLPIAILPAAGLLLGIGGALSNPNTVKAYPILDITLLQNIFTLMSAAGSIGVPAVINRNGIRNVVEIPLNDEEQSKFAHSAKTLKDIMAEAEELK